MNYNESNLWNLFGNNLSNNLLDNRVIQKWSKNDCNVSRFYTTGFETILFSKERSFVLETVLSSSVSWDKEIIIAGNSKSVENLTKTVSKQNLSYHCFDWSSDSWDEFEENLSKYSNVTHLLVGIDSTSIDNVPIKKLLQLSAKNRYSLIVYSDTDVNGLNDIFDGAIDYMIGCVTEEPPLSFVIARRNRLVQTEGKTRSFGKDLYMFWQWSMQDRAPYIEPVRF
jgi:hypothetical protein